MLTPQRKGPYAASACQVKRRSDRACIPRMPLVYRACHRKPQSAGAVIFIFSVPYLLCLFSPDRGRGSVVETQETALAAHIECRLRRLRTLTSAQNKSTVWLKRQRGAVGQVRRWRP